MPMRSGHWQAVLSAELTQGRAGHNCFGYPTYDASRPASKECKAVQSPISVFSACRGFGAGGQWCYEFHTRTAWARAGEWWSLRP